MQRQLRAATVSILLPSIISISDAADLSGQVTAVIDGDDIVICAPGDRCTDIRLCGMDAPERACPGFANARSALLQLVEGKTVRCIQVGAGTVCDGRSKPTNRNRVVAQCFVDGLDIAANLVERGFACDWTKFSGGHYSLNGKGRACPRNHRRTCAAALPTAQ